MRRAATLALLALLAAAPGAAQRPDSTRNADANPFIARRVAIAGGAFAAAALAVMPLDRAIARQLRDSTIQANRFLRHASRDVELVTTPGSTYIGVGLYVVGRIARVEPMADLGLHGTESVFLAVQVTDALKALAGRARPFVERDTNPFDFSLGRGLLRHAPGYDSFPSGHATEAFAAAASVTAEVTRRWPRGEWIVGPLLYGGAALVGVSRAYHDVHWASDVVLGAGVGTVTGLTTVRWQHAHPGNRLDRWLLPAVHVDRRDVRLLWSAAAP